MKRILSLMMALVLTATLLPVRARAAKGGKLIALTFDDGPSSKYTAQLLDGLKERGVPVTFFILGQNAKSNPSLIKRAYEEGHEIACHTWSHPELTGCSTSEIKKEIEDTFEELDRACGDEADYLVRPPYGSTNQKVRNAINAPLIHWSVDSEDWSLRNVAKVRRKIVSDSYDGAIILCHDIHKTTIPAALAAIDDLMDMGYEFVTVSELYRRRGRELKDHERHYNSNRNGIDYGPIPAPLISYTADTSGVNTVTITCSDQNAPIYYTTDGSYPNQDAKRYTGPFKVSRGTQITAVAAYKLNGSRSALTKVTANAIQIVSPTITLNEQGAVVMQTPTVGAQVRFTVDNTRPNGNSTLYTSPKYVEGDTFLRAVTVLEGRFSTETTAYMSEQGILYHDIYKGQWFYDAMDWAHRMGILNGTAPYTMAPDGIVTRGMLVTLLYRFSGESLETTWEKTNCFADVNQSYYYAEAIEWAYRNQIVEGYSANAFGPDDLVTRQQTCKIVAAYLNWLETPLAPGESCEEKFADCHEVAPWAMESVNAMVSTGLIQGDGVNLNPNAGTNRAQFCVILLRLVEYIDNYVPVEPSPTDPEPTESEPPVTELQPTGPEITEPEPTESLPAEPETTKPEATEPEITEPQPEHIHTWKINHTDVSVHVGERIRLSIYCSGKGCSDVADTPWIPDTPGVVEIDGRYISGVKAGTNTWLRAEWEGVSYACIVRVRKLASAVSDICMPM